MTATTTRTTRTGFAYRHSSPVGELPILVGILAILIGLVGLFFLLVGLLVTLGAVGFALLPAASAYAVFSGTALLAGVITLVFGAVLVFVATGLWDLEVWALALTGIVVALLVVLLVVAGSFGWSLLISVALLIYLVAVRGHFY
ncbi:MAG: hypothetical protein L3K07_00205 [Thermoplasmata archaeon]|nr:hypothetical protein [Thermoplasmata archaeon]